MSLTEEQIQILWIQQQQQNSPRYKLMDATQQAAFNMNLLAIYNESSRFILARYGGKSINFGITPSVDVSAGTISTLAPTLSLNIGVDANGNPLIQNIKTTNQLFITQITNGGATNAYNFYAGDNIDSLGNASPNLSGLVETWEYDNDPTLMTSKREYVRSLSDMNTWNQLEPDQFAPNKYFLVTSGNELIWTAKFDPTQTVTWNEGHPSQSGGMPLDQGLNTGKYNPSHPELINSEWVLQSHVDAIHWVWEFNYPDPSYVIKITRQTNGTYKHTFNSTMITPSEWFNSYVGSSSGKAATATAAAYVSGLIFPESVFPLRPQ
jgi:hypothetical protein